MEALVAELSLSTRKALAKAVGDKWGELCATLAFPASAVAKCKDTRVPLLTLLVMWEDGSLTGGKTPTLRDLIDALRKTLGDAAVNDHILPEVFKIPIERPIAAPEAPPSPVKSGAAAEAMTATVAKVPKPGHLRSTVLPIVPSEFPSNFFLLSLPSPFFTGRVDELSRLEEALLRSPSQKGLRVVLLHSDHVVPWGMGCRELVAQYAFLNQDKYPGGMFNIQHFFEESTLSDLLIAAELQAHLLNGSRVDRSKWSTTGDFPRRAAEIVTTMRGNKKRMLLSVAANISTMIGTCYLEEFVTRIMPNINKLGANLADVELDIILLSPIPSAEEKSKLERLAKIQPLRAIKMCKMEPHSAQILFYRILHNIPSSQVSDETIYEHISRLSSAEQAALQNITFTPIGVKPFSCDGFTLTIKLLAHSTRSLFQISPAELSAPGSGVSASSATPSASSATPSASGATASGATTSSASSETFQPLASFSFVALEKAIEKRLRDGGIYRSMFVPVVFWRDLASSEELLALIATLCLNIPIHGRTESEITAIMNVMLSEKYARVLSPKQSREEFQKLVVEQMCGLLGLCNISMRPLPSSYSEKAVGSPESSLKVSSHTPRISFERCFLVSSGFRVVWKVAHEYLCASIDDIKAVLDYVGYAISEIVIPPEEEWCVHKREIPDDHLLKIAYNVDVFFACSRIMDRPEEKKLSRAPQMITWYMHAFSKEAFHYQFENRSFDFSEVSAFYEASASQDPLEYGDPKLGLAIKIKVAMKFDPDMPKGEAIAYIVDCMKIVVEQRPVPLTALAEFCVALMSYLDTHESVIQCGEWILDLIGRKPLPSDSLAMRDAKFRILTVLTNSNFDIKCNQGTVKSGKASLVAFQYIIGRADELCLLRAQNLLLMAQSLGSFERVEFAEQALEVIKTHGPFPPSPLSFFKRIPCLSAEILQVAIVLIPAYMLCDRFEDAKALVEYVDPMIPDYTSKASLDGVPVKLIHDTLQRFAGQMRLAGVCCSDPRLIARAERVKPKSYNPLFDMVFGDDQSSARHAVKSMLAYVVNRPDGVRSPEEVMATATPIRTHLVSLKKAMEASHHGPDAVCAACKKKSEDLKICSRCKLVAYCSVSCQKAHWPTHKQTCKKK